MIPLSVFFSVKSSALTAPCVDYLKDPKILQESITLTQRSLVALVTIGMDFLPRTVSFYGDTL